LYKEDSQYILDRMLSDSNTSGINGTFIYDAFSPMSKELSICKDQIEDVLSKAFAKTAYENGFSDELALKASEHGVIRKLGKKATGLIKICGVKNTKIPKGFIVQTKTGLQYRTTEEVSIADNGELIIDIISDNEGTKYNQKANKIVEAPIQLVGVISINNEADIVDGRDTETDEALYNRLCIKVQTPATSGNVYHYLNWALECGGVGNAIVKPLWDKSNGMNGNGTVKVILVDSSGRCPSSEIIEETRKHIEENRPIGATVTVIGVAEININVTAKLIMNSNISLDDIKLKIQDNICNYLKDISLKSSKVRINKIGGYIVDILEVADYQDLKINADVKDIELDEGCIAILESVVVDSVT